MADALNVKMGMFFDDPDDMDSWEMEIEAIIILLKSKRGKSIRKIYKRGEVLGEWRRECIKKLQLCKKDI